MLISIIIQMQNVTLEILENIIIINLIACNTQYQFKVTL